MCVLWPGHSATGKKLDLGLYKPVISQLCTVTGHQNFTIILKSFCINNNHLDKSAGLLSKNLQMTNIRMFLPKKLLENLSEWCKEQNKSFMPLKIVKLRKNFQRLEYIIDSNQKSHNYLRKKSNKQSVQIKIVKKKSFLALILP